MQFFQNKSATTATWQLTIYQLSSRLTQDAYTLAELDIHMKIYKRLPYEHAKRNMKQAIIDQLAFHFQ